MTIFSPEVQYEMEAAHFAYKHQWMWDAPESVWERIKWMAELWVLYYRGPKYI